MIGNSGRVKRRAASARGHKGLLFQVNGLENSVRTLLRDLMWRAVRVETSAGQGEGRFAFGDGQLDQPVVGDGFPVVDMGDD